MLVSPKEINVGDIIQPFSKLETLCEVLQVERVKRSSRLWLKTLEGFEMPCSLQFAHSKRIEKVGA